MTAGRVLRGIGIVVAVVALVIAVVPFHAPTGFPLSIDDSATSANLPVGDSAVLVSSTNSACGPAIVDAWRAHDVPGPGWFGYAPLASNPAFSRCRSAARDRLNGALAVLTIAIVVALLAEIAERPPGFRSRRLRPTA